MQVRRRWLVIAVLLVMTFPAWQEEHALAQAQAFVATGQARIIGGNINLAQQRALEAALRFALEAALNTLVEP
ncbi:MAG: hypothetical protein QN131_13630, partial [Armatimonadota bacterium]|nr:hypothetical protein [Armatimonadota bacterium]